MKRRRFNTPLYLPEGSIRSIIVLLIVITGCAIVLHNVFGHDQKPEDWFITAFGLAIGFYLGERSARRK